MARDGYRCVACGFDLQCALAAHHRLPRDLGGRDTPSNLVTLCANCHKAVHWLAVEGRQHGQEADRARRLYPPTAFAKLIDLAEAIRARRDRTKSAGHSWVEEKDAEGLGSRSGMGNPLAFRRRLQEAEVPATPTLKRSERLGCIRRLLTF